MKAALVTWLLDRKIKLVHVWPTADKTTWEAMVESPPCGTRAGALTYPADQKVGVGHGAGPLQAVLSALGKIDGVTLELRLHVLGFMVDHLANRAGPAFLRSIEHGRS